MFGKKKDLGSATLEQILQSKPTTISPEVFALKNRQFIDINTGKILSRREVEKRDRGIIFEEKAAKNKQENPEESLSRPAPGRKKLLSDEEKKYKKELAKITPSFILTKGRYASLIDDPIFWELVIKKLKSLKWQGKKVVEMFRLQAEIVVYNMNTEKYELNYPTITKMKDIDDSKSVNQAMSSIIELVNDPYEFVSSQLNTVNSGEKVFTGLNGIVIIASSFLDDARKERKAKAKERKEKRKVSRKNKKAK